MLKYLLAVSKWAWTERDFLASFIPKYQKLQARGQFDFDGDDAKDAIREYEPLIYATLKHIVVDGLSLKQAAFKAVMARFAPHPMTREEEEEWFRRASGDGQF